MAIMPDFTPFPFFVEGDEDTTGPEAAVPGDSSRAPTRCPAASLWPAQERTLNAN